MEYLCVPEEPRDRDDQDGAEHLRFLRVPPHQIQVAVEFVDPDRFHPPDNPPFDVPAPVYGWTQPDRRERLREKCIELVRLHGHPFDAGELLKDLEREFGQRRPRPWVAELPFHLQYT